jgi:excisionase family DNA binding protein
MAEVNTIEELQQMRRELAEIRRMMQMALKLKRPQPWMTQAEAARLLGVSVRTLGRRYIDSGEVRTAQRGGRLMLRRVDVEEARR